MNPKSAQRPVRVLVVDDSLTARKHLMEVLAADPGFEIVGEGTNGKDAIELCQRLKPDVITLDMVMPVMSGLTATEYIMAYCPTPILIVSASVNRKDALRTLDALAAGAVDVLDKPSADSAGDPPWTRRFLSAVRVASRVRVVTRPRPVGGAEAAEIAAPAVDGQYRFVAIGASTGGPQALMEILRGLPADFSLPILLVVHLDARFDASFRDWLDSLGGPPVRHAEDSMPLPKPGTRGVWLAPADRHLIVDAGKLRLSAAPERNSCRPSVDALFESVAREGGAQAIGCLLTGMGVDGAAGLAAMREAGAMTLAQNEATSVIFGMPGAAIARGAAVRVLALDEFAPTLALLARSVPPAMRRRRAPAAGGR